MKRLLNLFFFFFLILLSILKAQILQKPSYPVVSFINSDVEDGVPMTLLEKIADRHANWVWGNAVGRGQALALTNRNGKVVAYVFPYIRGIREFPGYQAIFDSVRLINQLHLSTLGRELSQLSERFGSIYVSANRQNPPILRVDHFLHPYFTSGLQATEEARRYFNSEDVQLTRLFLQNICDEYFEFASKDKRLLLDIHTLKVLEPSQVLAQHVMDFSSPILAAMHEVSWSRLEELINSGTDDRTIFSMDNIKYLKDLQLVPSLIWTLNCATTAKAMVIGYWDHYIPGVGTYLGFGRLIDYWYEHPSDGENVPNLIEECHAEYGINLWQVNNYTCTWTETQANSANNWAWQEYISEIDNDRPACWSYEGHTMAGVGYRTDPIEPGAKWAITYNTYNTNLTEYYYTLCVGVAQIIPQSPSQGQNCVITEPYGNESYSATTPTEISWYVWGNQIDKTHLMYSGDGGRNWIPLASDLPTQEGWNSYRWLPGPQTLKGRVRLQTYAGNDYIAGDGSYNNFSIQPQVTGNSWTNVFGPVGTFVAGYDKSNGTRAIYATELATGDVYQFMGVPGVYWNWIKVGQPGKMFVLDGQGKLYGLSVDGNAVYQYTGTPMEWIQIGLAAKEIYSDIDGICSINSETGDIYRYLGSPFSWLKVGGPCKTLGYDSKGSLYALAPDGSGIWQYNGLLGTPIPWIQISGPATNLYARGMGVYATTDVTGDIHFYHGIPYHWTRVGGPGNKFSVDTEGRLYSLSLGNDVFRHDGSLSSPTHWTQIGGLAADIFAGSGEILAMSPDTKDLWLYTSVPVGVEEDQKIQLTLRFFLEQNYPNPFNPSTKISWQLPFRSQVTIKIYDVLGREVKILMNEEKEAGYHSIDFNASDIPSGVYFYRIKAANFIDTKKMVLLK